MQTRSTRSSASIARVLSGGPLASLLAVLAGGVVSPAALAQVPVDRYTNAPTPTRVDFGINGDEIEARQNSFWRPVSIRRAPGTPPRYNIVWVRNATTYGYSYWLPYNASTASMNFFMTTFNPPLRPYTVDAIDLIPGSATWDTAAVSNLLGPRVELAQGYATLNAMRDYALANGLRIHEIVNTGTLAAPRYGGLLIANAGALGRVWQAHSALTPAALNTALAQLGHRVLDLRVRTTDPVTIDAVSVPVEGLAWSYAFDQTRDGLLTAAAGARSRIVDIDSYLVNGQERFAGVMLGNSNDAAANALPLGTGSFSSSTLTFVADGFTTCGAQFNSDVWYFYTAPGRGQLRLSTCGTPGASVVSAHTGLPATTTNQIVCAAGNQGGCGSSNGSVITVNTARGAEYYVRVGTPTPGAFTLTTSFVQPNDNCAQATNIAGDVSDLPFGTIGATTDGPSEPFACAAPGAAQYDNDVWFRWRPSKTGVAVIDTAGAAFDTKVAIYASCPTASGQPIACNDDAGGALGAASRVELDVVKGVEYVIRVGGTRGAAGDADLSAVATCYADFNNDDELTFDDIQKFIGDYNDQAPRADMNRDQEWTFDDIQRFVTFYNAGC